MRIIAGEARSRTIEAPAGRDTRPTLDRVRENLFNILQQQVRGARVLDLFSGSGALALEALSRGAKSAVMVDVDPAAIRCIRANTEKLRYTDRAQILHCDWRQALSRLTGQQFDLVLLDPPYAMHDLSEVTLALRPLLAPSALITVEHEAKTMVQVADGFDMTDDRRWGIAGVSFFRQTEE